MIFIRSRSVKYFLCTAALFLIPLMSISARAQSEDAQAQLELVQSAEALFSDGKLEEAAIAYKSAAASSAGDFAAGAAFNYAVIRIMQAQSSQDLEEQRLYLTESIGFLRRALELRDLPFKQQEEARKNLELAMELFLQLPPPGQESPEQDSGGQDDSRDTQEQEGDSSQSSQDSSNSEQDGKNQSGNSDSGANQQSGSSAESSDSQGNDPQSLLDRQRELSNKTESSSGSEQELAEQQRSLEQASRQAAELDQELAGQLNAAAAKQADAAQALMQGDSEAASRAQAEAEESLMQAVMQQMRNNQEIDDILNQEADREAQARSLDTKGGGTDVDKNW